ncbi:hypothetical protein BDN72DRAFT_657870 [Pluteus cervinus]|uniref:Uncharacterized protein n=1 Tax=Pluteus cervinus TaxID=181527 RepID=A0ACD3ASU3_9AGAR|nr:hypothetical protein BDN72DRAFT_657870 [Pluteus cervinus]
MHMYPRSASQSSKSANPTQTAMPAGQKALTPIIAGSVSGGIVGLAWIIGLIIYLVKRYKLKQMRPQNRTRKGDAALESQNKMLEDDIVIPPDPAVLLGHRLPGEKVFETEKDLHHPPCPDTCSPSCSSPHKCGPDDVPPLTEIPEEGTKNTQQA